MARIPDAELTRIKAEVSVQRLVEGCGVELRSQGKDLVGCCPFHDDDSPSLVVTPAKNLWHCLGACGRGGGPIDWVMTAQGVSFRHAVELLRESSPSLASLAQPGPRSTAPGPVARSKSAKLPSLVEPDAGDAELLGMVVGHYAEALAGHGDALAFLARRRIDDPEAIEAFRVGFGDRTLGYRIPHSRTADGSRVRGRLRGLGVIKTSGHEHFRGCLTFPILDGAGQVGEIYGRRLDPHTDPRHLYLPGPHRGVWNPAAFEADELIVCESIIDALTLWCAGFRHVTAAYGVDGDPVPHQRRDAVLVGPTHPAGPRLRESVRDGQGGCLSPVPPHPGHVDARRRGRHPLHPGDARPRRTVHDPDLHPSVDQGAAGSPRRDLPRRIQQATTPRVADLVRRRFRAGGEGVAAAVACCS